MKKLLIVFLILISVHSFAQSQSDVESLCQIAVSAAQKGDFAIAKQNYDLAIAQIAKKPNSDLVLAVPEDLSEYIIITQAKTSPEEVRKKPGSAP